jgi:hypothetical protein
MSDFTWMKQQRLVWIEMDTKQLYFNEQWLNKTLNISLKQHKDCQYNLVQLENKYILQRWNEVNYIKHVLTNGL